MRDAVRASVLLAALAGCGAAPHREVRWPASFRVPIEHALARGATERGLDDVLLPDGTRVSAESVAPRESDDEDEWGPIADVRSAVFEGLWYAEIVIGEVDPDAPLPLVVALHGRGDRPRLPDGPFLRTPTPMRIVVPRGPLALGTGFAWARQSVTRGRPDELADELVPVVDRLARLVEHVRSTRPTRGTPVATGFSQGGILSWMLALAHPESVGGALVIAGWVPPRAFPEAIPGVPRRCAPVRALHGTADPIVPIAGTRVAAEAARALGCDVELVEVEGVAHTVTPEMNARLEAWLEAALDERAPGLPGGPGVAGPDPEPYAPHEPPLPLDLSEAADAPAPLHEDSPPRASE